MSESCPVARPVVEWGAVWAAMPGQTVCGDVPFAVPFADGCVVAVIDGLGHGQEAREASIAASSVLERHAGEPVSSLVQRCHDELRQTRGAALTLASFDAVRSTMTWVGVGNVDGVLVRASLSARPMRHAIILRSGVVGYQLPPLRVAELPVAYGDTVVLASDGIRQGFERDIVLEDDPQCTAEGVMARCARGSDDACVLVARYVGGIDVTLPVRDESDVAMARKHLRELAERQGLPEASIEALATAVTELARNILVHAGEGELVFTVVRESDRSGVAVVARDRGPGIADVDLAMKDGFTTGAGLGLGLSSARRLVDEFSIESAPGRGTTVKLRQWRP